MLAWGYDNPILTNLRKQFVPFWVVSSPSRTSVLFYTVACRDSDAPAHSNHVPLSSGIWMVWQLWHLHRHHHHPCCLDRLQHHHHLPPSSHSVTLGHHQISENSKSNIKKEFTLLLCSCTHWLYWQTEVTKLSKYHR